MTSTQIQATCVSIGKAGVLLLGPSGSGKSDLALRLIDRGALLVADDRVDITCYGGELLAAAPAALQGKIEARGIGILTLPHTSAPLKLAVQLVAREAVPRLPEPDFWHCLNRKLPLLSLHGFDQSACIKITRFISL